MERQKKIQKYEYMLYAISMMVYIMGIICYLVEYCSIKITIKCAICVMVSMVAVLCFLLSYRFPNRQKLIPVIPLSITVFFLAVRSLGIVRGIGDMINERILRWNTFHEDGKNVIAVGEADLNDICATVLAVSFLVLALMLWWKIKTKMFAGMCIALVLGVTDLMLGITNAWVLSCFIAGIFGIWFSQVKRGLWFVKVFWSLLIASSLFVVSLINGKNIEMTKNFRESTKQMAEDARYRKSTLPEGNLYEADQMENGDDKMLQVQTQQVKSLYLRGFEGGCYEDGKWKELKKSSYGYEHSGILDWLQKNNFTPAKEYEKYRSLGENTEEENRVEITNLGADREYLYLPYSVINIKGQQYTEEKDTGFRSTAFFGTSKYEFRETSPDLPGELFVADKWIKSPQTDAQKNYMQAESVYRKFVYEEYCEVDKTLQSYIQSTFYDSASSEDMTGAYAIANHIRSVLKNTVSYRRVPEAVPAESDPIYWFMTKGKEGNSALFASTAVMAFRAFGIPARYAEGYLLEKEDVEKAAGGKVMLTKKNSHAWVEIYLDGLGWIDIDVTPGYYYEEYALMQMVEEPQGVQLTADLEDKNNNGNGQGEGTGGGAKHPKRQELSIANLVVTILMLICIIIVLILVVLEVRRWLRFYYWKRRLQHMDSGQRCNYMQKILFYRLQILGIEAALGWQVKEVEIQIQKYVPTVYEGEFQQVNDTLEKNIYGGQELTEWEFRCLYEFINKLLFDITWKNGIMKYIKYRYL